MNLPPRTDPYAALRLPEFRYYTLGSFLFTSALLIQEVVLGYELYALTHNPLALGLIGLAEAVPYIALALFGGYYADNRDKKTIILRALGVILVGSVVLLWATHPSVRVRIGQTALFGTIYGVLFLIGLAKGFFGPATASLKAFLTPRELYANASVWYSTAWQAGAIIGPGAAGFLYAYLGLTGALLLVVGLLGGVAIFQALIERKPIPDGAGGGDLFGELREGIRYVFAHKIILYSITLDLIAVLFGGVVAILPVFAQDILRVGAEGLGVLRAAPAVGALLMFGLLAYYPPTTHAWRNMLVAVAGFGLATIVFALSTHFWLSVVMLFLTGAFDGISVVIRQTILQVMPPDHMRGRVASVNGIFVSSSNEIGAFESGVAAKLFGTVPSVLLGGGLTLLLVAYVWTRSKDLFRVKLS
jgi:MFS family permease